MVHLKGPNNVVFNAKVPAAYSHPNNEQGMRGGERRRVYSAERSLVSSH
jgi:hypothetical protein